MGRVFLLTIFLTSVLYSSGISQQHAIDSFKQLLHNNPDDYKIKQGATFELSYLYWIYHQDSINLAEDYAIKSLTLATDNKNNSWRIASLNQLARINRSKENLAESLTLFDSAATIALATNDSMKWAQIADNKASILVDLGHIEEGILSNKQAYEVFKSAGDSTAMAIANNGLGYIYIKRKEYRKALPLFFEAMNLAPKWKLAHSEWCGNIAIIYRELNKPDSARYYFDKAIDYSQTIPDVQALNYHELSKLYANQNYYDGALSAIQKAIQLKGSLAQDEDYNYYRIQEANYLSKLGRVNEARTIFQATAPQLALSPQPSSTGHVGAVGADIFSQTGDYKRALEYYKMKIAARDSISNTETNARIKEIEVRYKTAENQATIAQLQLEEEQTSAKLSRTRNILIASILGLIGLSFFIYRIRIQNKKIAQQRDELNKANDEKDLLLREIHHRVKNNLQTISSLLSLQSRQIRDEKAKIAINDGRSRVRSMALIHQNLYQKEALTSINARKYFENLIHEINETYQVNATHIRIESIVDEIDIDVDTMIPIGLIVNELITNSLKHAFHNQKNGKIAVKLSTVGEEIHLSVSDNGAGNLANADKVKSGFGERMIQAFVEKLKGKIATSTDGGYHTEISFPKLTEAA